VSGLEQGAKLRKHGLRASHTVTDVFLDDVRVPESHLLGGQDRLDARLARARRGPARAGTPRWRPSR